jgi:hypothetical protein
MANLPPPRNARFRSGTPLALDDGSPIPAEWDLRCSGCDYDLTGLSARRCPECGRRFDPHALWARNRQREAGAFSRTPAYVSYGVLVVGLLMVLPVVAGRPWVLLPLLVVPGFELLAFFYQWETAGTRSIIMALAAIACVVVWSMSS